MKKLIVSKRVVRRLKRIIEDIRVDGRSRICPAWKTRWHASCEVCREHFPRTVHAVGCPCSLYTPGYLIKRLGQIIRDSE